MSVSEAKGIFLTGWMGPCNACSIVVSVVIGSSNAVRQAYKKMFEVQQCVRDEKTNLWKYPPAILAWTTWTYGIPPKADRSTRLNGLE